MPESRDRLTRRDFDIAAVYSQRRIANFSYRDRDVPRVSPVIFSLRDDDEERQQTPFRWRGTTMVGTPGPMRFSIGRGSSVTPRIGRFTPILGPENLSPFARNGRGRGSPLPSWYPRRPLNNVTSVVRAIERRGDHPTRIGELMLRIQSPINLPGQILNDASSSGFKTPCPVKPCFPSIDDRVQKILHEVTNLNQKENERGDKESDLTPEKKLLNSLDTVEKVVMEEIRKLKRTPSAKRVEREKRVRTLMSMR